MNTVTGQCDHIVGFLISDFPQYGERDRLVRASENEGSTQGFRFCPACGVATNGECQPAQKDLLGNE